MRMHAFPEDEMKSAVWVLGPVFLGNGSFISPHYIKRTDGQHISILFYTILLCIYLSIHLFSLCYQNILFELNI
jgi:hypothetical protein